jgi:hypothetical protein
MEDKLDEWTKKLREAGCCISGFTTKLTFTLKVKSIQILREMDKFDGMFCASDGWLQGFLRRKNYSLRRITTTGRDLPSDFLVNESELGSESESSSSEEELLDKNGKRGECGATTEKLS